jgi:hypothetical protein
MKPIGGYFELELKRGKEYHSDAIKLNTGRNAFEYILRAKGYKKVYIPYYTCDVMLEPIGRLKLDYEFYSIGENFLPKFDFSKVKKEETFVYTNYFGICDKQVKEVVSNCRNVIIDNSQAFFSKPIEGLDTFYSPRKFFGVSDGAYLYTDKELKIDLKQDKSSTRFSHLLGRVEDGPEEHYLEFKKNDEKLKDQPIQKMSRLTERILQSIDYDNAISKRRENYLYLHKHLQECNGLDASLEDSEVPMVYPYLTKEKGLREHLIRNKIFVAKYWPNVEEWAKKESVEYEMQEYLLPLPLDQRSCTMDMDLILELIAKYGG